MDEIVVIRQKTDVYGTQEEENPGHTPESVGENDGRLMAERASIVYPSNYLHKCV